MIYFFFNPSSKLVFYGIRSEMIANSDNNNVVYFARLHWIVFFAPILCLLICAVIWGTITTFHQILLFFGIFALLWFGMTWVTYYFTSLTIQQKQVILRTGVLVRQTVDIPLTKIETIDIRQSILGSLFKYGTLIITGTGGTRHFINNLQRPLTCRRYIEQLMNQQ